MKILVVSDSHRDFPSLLSAYKLHKDADLLVHLGDGESDIRDFEDVFAQLPIVYVGGNCDFGCHETSHIIRTKEGVNIFCCHGHTMSVKSTLDILTENARQNACDIALYGHTHVAFNDIVNGIRVMNPGSTSLPRGGKAPSCGVIEIDKNRVITMSIHFLGDK